MAIIGIGGPKGGTGKTTLSINIAVALAHTGAKVSLLDADKLHSAKDWASLREGLDVPQITCKNTVGDIDDVIVSMARESDFLIIDAGGFDGPEMMYSLAYSHHFIAPLQPSAFDLRTISQINERIAVARPVNRRLKAHALISRVSNQPNSSITTYAKDFFTTNKPEQLDLLSSFVHELNAYKRCSITGRGVIEMKGELKAKSDIELLIQELGVCNGH